MDYICFELELFPPYTLFLFSLVHGLVLLSEMIATQISSPAQKYMCSYPPLKQMPILAPWTILLKK